MTIGFIVHNMTDIVVLYYNDYLFYCSQYDRYPGSILQCHIVNNKTDIHCNIEPGYWSYCEQ
jgi:hypothetical protein